MLHATDTKLVPATVQEATRHLVRGFSVASSIVPHSVVSLLLLLTRCLCALFIFVVSLPSPRCRVFLSSQFRSRDISAASFQTSGRADNSIPEASHDSKKA